MERATDKAGQYLRVAEGLDGRMHLWRPVWERLARRIMPRRVADGPLPESHEWHNSVACSACTMLASGHVSYITPVNQRWFSYKAPGVRPKEAARRWYAQCTEAVEDAIAASNFYTAVHEVYIDRCLYGTGCLLCESEDDGGLLFKHVPTGTYSIAEDAHGRVNTLCRTFKLSAQQAADEFGEENLGEKLKECLADAARRYDVCHEFIHLVRPRKKGRPESLKATDRPFESVYVCKEDRKVVDEGGYYEFPYLVTRFIRWGDGPYGLAPGVMAEPDIYRCQFLDEVLDTLGEVAAFPRILKLAEQVGEVDMRAGGETIIQREAAQLNFPREWATQGRYDIGMDRLQSKEERIERAFFADMLRVISGVERAMTATEVAAREGEKVLSFYPSYTLMVSDLRPLMERIFAVQYRAGRFPAPPQDVVKGNRVGVPGVAYRNRISASLEKLQGDALNQSIGLLGGLAQVPQWSGAADVIDPREAARHLYRSAGGPEDVLRSEDDLREMDEQRLAQEQVMLEQQMQGGQPV